VLEKDGENQLKR